jgi:hypothetical protein
VRPLRRTAVSAPRGFLSTDRLFLRRAIGDDRPGRKWLAPLPWRAIGDDRPGRKWLAPCPAFALGGSGWPFALGGSGWPPCSWEEVAGPLAPTEKRRSPLPDRIGEWPLRFDSEIPKPNVEKSSASSTSTDLPSADADTPMSLPSNAQLLKKRSRSRD